MGRGQQRESVSDSRQKISSTLLQFQVLLYVHHADIAFTSAILYYFIDLPRCNYVRFIPFCDLVCIHVFSCTSVSSTIIFKVQCCVVLPQPADCTISVCLCFPLLAACAAAAPVRPAAQSAVRVASAPSPASSRPIPTRRWPPVSWPASAWEIWSARSATARVSLSGAASPHGRGRLVEAFPSYTATLSQIHFHRGQSGTAEMTRSWVREPK